jgi:hypothetical protein
LPFANVLIKGSNENTTTDIDGKYTISTAAGVHIIQFSFIGYQICRFSNSERERVVTVNIALVSSYKLDDVVITTVNKQKETALLLEQKNAVEIKQAIGTQELSRKGVEIPLAQSLKLLGLFLNKKALKCECKRIR